jgi:magnesium-protoporphyrin IX monomethyl ester (oxidative) cyclase
MDICLVNMPYAPVRVPSIALGILQAILEKDGFSVSSLYPNIRFASEIGVGEYSRLWMILRSENAIAEWTFAHIAFPEYATNAEDFLKLLDERNSHFLDLPDPVGRLLTVREKASLFVDQLAEGVLASKPKILGCTSTFFQHVSSLALLRKIREIDPAVITLMGGANCESIMGITTHRMFDWLDYVVSGEAEDIISDLIRKAFMWGTDIPKDEIPFGVFGPAHRELGYPCDDQPDNPDYPRAVTRDLDKHPVPNYDDYFNVLSQTPDVCREIRPGILVEASRGCWWQKNDGCSFCGLNGAGKKYRRKTVPVILNELGLLENRYGINRFEMVDNVLYPGFIDSLVPELIELGSRYDIFFEIRPGLNRSQFEQLRQAGVIWVQPGIESLHSNILRLMNKGSEGWQNVQILKWVSQFGIRCSWILMYGLPGEEDLWYEEMAEYLPHLSHLQAPRSLTRVRFVRFSHYHSTPDKYNLKLSPAKPFSLVYPIAEHDLNNLVYYFDEEEQLRQQRAPFVSEFILRPGFLKVKKIQQDWLRLQESDAPPVLIMETASDSLIITDSRPGAKAAKVSLKGLEKNVYLACDEAPLEEELLDMFKQNGCDPQEVHDVLTRHVENSIILNMDGRYVSLALRHPVQPLSPYQDFPGGSVVAKDSALSYSWKTRA